MFFDADDDNLQTQAGIQVKTAEDRFFLQASISNGNESQSQYSDGQPSRFQRGFWVRFRRHLQSGAWAVGICSVIASPMLTIAAIQ